MSIKKKIVGLGTTVVAAATVLSMGVGSAGAAVITEIDGAVRQAAGTQVLLIVDADCAPGDILNLNATINQVQKNSFPTNVQGSSSFFGTTYTCNGVHDDVQVAVNPTGFIPGTFKNGKAFCDVSAFNTTTGEFTDSGTTACKISAKYPLT